MSRNSGSNKEKILILFTIFILFFGFITIPTNADDNLLPDLIPNDLSAPPIWPAEEEVEIIFKIKNVGTKNVSAGEEINVGMFVDYGSTPVATNFTTEGLNIGKTCFVNISWIPTISDGEEHNISIMVNYNQIIEELSFSNNNWAFKVVFTEKDTDLEVLNINVPDGLVVGGLTNIEADIKNTGKSTNQKIYVVLNSSEEGEIQTKDKINGLVKNGEYTFTFDWTPTLFGKQTLSIDLLLVNKTHDYEEVTVNVGVGQLDWWDENWHYRYFLTANGSGNASHTFNFTELLNELDVISQNFENDTIRIIEYSTNGMVIGEEDIFKFNESSDYIKENNAKGTLIWAVPSNPQLKYYCVYFDVEINSGIRPSSSETESIEESGDPVVELGFVDGWKVEITSPMDGGYTLITDPINITVLTDAMAKEIDAFVYLKNNVSHNFSLILSDVENQINWSYSDLNFSSEGDWIIEINNSLDDAGYIPPVVQHSFLVGKPDLKMKNISVTKELGSVDEIFLNDALTILANFVSLEATIEDVNISFTVTDKSDTEIIFKDNTTMTLIKNETKNYTFNWHANVSGNFKLSVTLDPEDLIDEENENNNVKSESITVQDWPDLTVTDINLPFGTIMEYEKVKFDMVIKNIGNGDATNFKVGLYIEEYSDEILGILKFENEVDNDTISVDAGDNKTISMNWTNAEAGIWLVGAKILVETWQKDLNFLNNDRLSDKKLTISSYERNTPKILGVFIEPKEQQQGGAITIFANVTDDSGLESVKLMVTDPSNHTFDEVNMIRDKVDIFKATFDDTLKNGIYEFLITAVDISINSNVGLYKGNFAIMSDETEPEITYFEVRPQVQLKNEYLVITCIAKDNVEVNTAIVIITSPTDVEDEQEMSYNSEGKFEYIVKYNMVGKYTFYILARDKAGNSDKTISEEFWITNDISDTDDDGIPDYWEIDYNLDPRDPTDANEDPDGDGLTNLKEYQLGTNPIRDIFGENVGARIKNNAGYLTGSIVLFFLIIILSYFGKRRRFR